MRINEKLDQACINKLEALKHQEQSTHLFELKTKHLLRASVLMEKYKNLRLSGY
ncbi:MAG: hypothetical protein KAI17_04500 [Thiotrichaceae bacterium]|nr:hypothetical protein [Thiotrichaceae bacterium]